jgi:hypothetical protein
MLGLVGAASLPDADELIRQGNAAFARGDYERAATHYRQAEEASTDPGLVAFNKAAALYQDGQYEEAEKHYWLSLGDAGEEVERMLRRQPDCDLPDSARAHGGPRLARVLYNLGNCVVQRSGGADGDALAWAVVLYDHCLRLAPDSAPLRADASHNLKLARDLVRLHPPKADKRDTSSDENSEDKNPKKSKDKSGAEEANSETAKTGPDKMEPDDTRDRSQGDDKSLPKGKRTPGKGNLASLPDSDKLTTLSPEQAAAFLQGAVQRIQAEERRDYETQTPEKASGKVLDW